MIQSRTFARACIIIGLLAMIVAGLTLVFPSSYSFEVISVSFGLGEAVGLFFCIVGLTVRYGRGSYAG